MFILDFIVYGVIGIAVIGSLIYSIHNIFEEEENLEISKKDNSQCIVKK